MDTNKTCGRCNTTVTSKNWARHRRSQKHLRNHSDQTLRPRRRRHEERACEKCGTTISPKGWTQHLRSQKHRRNDPDNTITPGRRGRPKTGKLHREVKLYESVFEEPKVRTIIRAKDSAFRSRIQTLEIENSRNFLDARRFLNNIKFPVIGHIRDKLITQNNNANPTNVKNNKTKKENGEKTSNTTST